MGIQKVRKLSSKASKSEPTGTKMEPKGSQKGAQREAKGSRKGGQKGYLECLGKPMGSHAVSDPQNGGG